MFRIAQECNQSETAFLVLRDKQSTFAAADEFDLRWFEPDQEDLLCGHGTLAAAAAVFQGKQNHNEAITFHTCMGPLRVLRSGGEESNRTPTLAMQLPVGDPRPQLPPSCPDASCDLVRSLIGGLQVHEVLFDAKLKYLLIVLVDGTTQQQLQKLVPRMQHAEQLSTPDEIQGAIVAACTASADSRDDTTKAHAHAAPDVCSRFFGPWTGADEDPVTGSAHCVLAPYFTAKLRKERLLCWQGSKRSGSIAVEYTSGDEYVTLKGDAHIVIKGQIKLPLAQSACAPQA